MAKTSTTPTTTPAPAELWPTAIAKIEQRNQALAEREQLAAALKDARDRVAHLERSTPDMTPEILAAARAGQPLPDTAPAKAQHAEELITARDHLAALTDAYRAVANAPERPLAAFDCTLAAEYMNQVLNHALAELRAIPNAAELAVLDMKTIVTRPDDVAHWNKIRDLTELCETTFNTPARLGFAWQASDIWETFDNREARRTQNYGTLWRELANRINVNQRHLEGHHTWNAYAKNTPSAQTVHVQETTDGGVYPGHEPWFDDAANYVEWLRAETLADTNTDTFSILARHQARHYGKRELYWVLTANAGVTFTAKPILTVHGLHADCKTMIDAVQSLNAETVSAALAARHRLAVAGVTLRTPYADTE